MWIESLEAEKGTPVFLVVGAVFVWENDVVIDL